MGIDEAIQYFGTAYKLCKSLGIRHQNIAQWRKKGTITYQQQIRLEQLTDGLLKADEWKPRHDQ